MFGQLHQIPIPLGNLISYLVIAGGGGASYGGGAGAGGYKNSYNNESSGGNSATLTPLEPSFPVTYSITIGGGGGGVLRGASAASKGSNTTFGNITSDGGGAGPRSITDSSVAGGGSGGGEGFTDTNAPAGGHRGSGVTGQGTRGGTAWDYTQAGAYVGRWAMAGGGGAGGQGVDVPQVGGGSYNGSAGGPGLSSQITGTAVARGGGGGGTGWGGAQAASGGSGGGGNGTRGTAAGSGTANTGGGGGASGTSGQATAGTNQGGSGGSGVVILRYPSTITGTYTNGLTVASSTDGAFTIDQITAGTGSVTFTSSGGGATNAVLNNSWRAWDSNSFTNGGTSCTDVTNGLVLGPYSSGSPGAFFYGSYNNVSGNKYWVLNGSASHARRAGFTRPTEFSISYWGNKPNNPGFNSERGIWAFNAFGTNHIRLVRRNNSNTQSLRIYSGNSAIATFADGMSLSTWYNITTTFSTDTVKTYIGAEGSSTTTLVNETTLSSGTFPTGVTNNGASGFWIGTTPGYTDWSSDSWSSLSIYDGVMPKSQIDTVVSDGYQQ
jgi:hypothetical protein